MTIKGKVGYILYVMASRLPASSSRIKVGQKTLRHKFATWFVDHVGTNVNIEDHAEIGRNLYIGDNSGIGSHSKIMPGVTIGNDVMMGPNCFICTRNHRFDDISIPMRKQGFDNYKPVTIGNDVWIGQNVMILPGVTIGDGSVIGGGAVVTKSFPPYSIIGGNPAKLLGSRIEKTFKTER